MMGRRDNHALAMLSTVTLLSLLALDSCGRSSPGGAAPLPTSPLASAAEAPDSARAGVNIVTKGQLQATPPGRTLIMPDGGGSAPRVLQPNPGFPAVPVRIFPPDNIWNRDIYRMPVHAKSNIWVAAIGAPKNLYVGFAPGTFGMRYVLTGSSTPKVSITFSGEPSECDPGPYPFNANTPIEAGTNDRHTFMIDTTTCTLYELYLANWNNGNPTAGAGMVFPLGSNALHPDGWSSADEAGLPIFPGVTRWDEVLSGSITHALRFEAASGHIDGTIGAHLWPARHDPHTSSVSNPGLPPMGARFRLKSSFNIYGFSPRAQVILRALKHYGMFLSDIGYDWELIGTVDSRWEDSVIEELETVPANQFEVVDESSLMIDPNSAQSLSPP
jgi:hypothetical protein